MPRHWNKTQLFLNELAAVQTHASNNEYNWKIKGLTILYLQKITNPIGGSWAAGISLWSFYERKT